MLFGETAAYAQSKHLLQEAPPCLYCCGHLENSPHSASYSMGWPCEETKKDADLASVSPILSGYRLPGPRSRFAAEGSEGILLPSVPPLGGRRRASEQSF